MPTDPTTRAATNAVRVLLAHPDDSAYALHYIGTLPPGELNSIAAACRHLSHLARKVSREKIRAAAPPYFIKDHRRPDLDTTF
jgi:hypothetical protein